MLLEEIMSVPVRTIHADATAEEALAELKRRKIRHLVVADAGRHIEGVLCAHDLRGASAEMPVAELMSSPVVTLQAKATAQDAARLMRRKNVGCLPLLERGKLAGIVTTSDLLGLLGRGSMHVQASTGKWVLAKRGPTHKPELHRAR